jgi:NADH-quinone oxidoreductase subunit E
MMNVTIELDAETKQKIIDETKKFPNKLAALLPALHIVQDKFGYMPTELEIPLAELLEIFPIKVREVMTFYSLLYDKPIGVNAIYICTNLTCCLEGCAQLAQHISKKLNVELNATTSNGKFSFFKTPCLGACEKAPVVIVNGKYHYNVTPEYIDKIISELE